MEIRNLIPLRKSLSFRDPSLCIRYTAMEKSQNHVGSSRLSYCSLAFAQRQRSLTPASLFERRSEPVVSSPITDAISLLIIALGGLLTKNGPFRVCACLQRSRTFWNGATTAFEPRNVRSCWSHGTKHGNINAVQLSPSLPLRPIPRL
jgi:hypothetical protein